jgi:hypothetical protein
MRQNSNKTSNNYKRYTRLNDYTWCSHYTSHFNCVCSWVRAPSWLFLRRENRFLTDFRVRNQLAKDNCFLSTLLPNSLVTEAEIVCMSAIAIILWTRALTHRVFNKFRYPQSLSSINLQINLKIETGKMKSVLWSILFYQQVLTLWIRLRQAFYYEWDRCSWWLVHKSE